jgi:hypothetical protein
VVDEYMCATAPITRVSAHTLGFISETGSPVVKQLTVIAGVYR